MPRSTTLGASTNLAGVTAAKMGPPLPEVIVRTLYEIKMCLQALDNKRDIGGGDGSRTRVAPFFFCKLHILKKIRKDEMAQNATCLAQFWRSFPG
jgi:hypothetical protein